MPLQQNVGNFETFNARSNANSVQEHEEGPSTLIRQASSQLDKMINIGEPVQVYTSLQHQIDDLKRKRLQPDLHSPALIAYEAPAAPPQQQYHPNN